ncbi:hypothetical protein BGZ80_005305 [Entomortierella chlamydospora]|uniref:Ima1 N-terminal domain-containing protein n=1 Tax=Entomortierella chlamydospora TaxID=101097 RepID=A0A9P6T2A5_9FUNG|nr:hypothetical protein BGZ80_005305 [Entomortierella chlamydospora]
MGATHLDWSDQQQGLYSTISLQKRINKNYCSGDQILAKLATANTRSLKNRKRPSSGVSNKPVENDFFCEICNGHQRVVYQLLSNYIPDEEDENYDAYYENADTYKRQLEERYPMACAKCMEKVQKELAQQNYRIKSSLLNATLNKSRGDKIRPTRKYPSVGWLFTGSSWLCAHGALLSVETINFFGPDVLPSSRIFTLPKRLAQSAGSLTLHNLTGALSKLNPPTQLLWSQSSGNPLLRLTEAEQSSVFAITLICLSIWGLYWDPLDFVMQRAPRIKIRARQYYKWVRASTIPLLIIQYYSLFFGRWQLDLNWSRGIPLLLHALYIAAFFNGRYIQEPNEVKFDSLTSYPSTSKTSAHGNVSGDDKRKATAKTSNSHATPSRSPAHSSESYFTSASRSFEDISRSQTSSPEINEINWSPKKSAPLASNRLSAAFGMYRDSNQSTRQDDTMMNTLPKLGHTGSLQEQQSRGFDYKPDNKFRSRAYEPSPLANPSLVTNMGLSNMSLGEMFGFPSAKFQPPENHFAHRSASQQGAGVSDAWSYRRTTEAGSANGHASNHRTRNRFSQSADFDMDEDDEDSQNLTSLSRRSAGPISMDTDHTNDIFSSFGFGSTTAHSTGNSYSKGSGSFAPQRYFPPEPETGLEDNFLGIVKIVDDYLPPQQGPRSIAGRNLMLKKRMARRWLSLLLFCRCIVLWRALSGGWKLDWVTQVIFAGAILHAAAFWFLDEYRLLKRYLDKESSSLETKKTSNDIDPFEPTVIDRVCSYLLLLLLAARILNMISWILVDKVSLGNLSATEDTCLLQDEIPGERCHEPTVGHPSLMDWSPGAIRLVYPGVGREEAAMAVAYFAGWMHDIAMIALFVVLVAFGAGSHTIKTNQSPAQEHKVRRRGN